MKKYIFLVAFSITVSICTAQILGPGTTAYTFLKLGVGVRPVAMGNAFTAISDDGNAVFWNPAGLGLIQSYYVSGMAMNHLTYWNYYNLTSAIMLGKKAGGLGIGLAYISAYDTEYDEFGEMGDDFRNSDMLLNVGYGNAIGRKRQVAFGGSVKVLRSQLYRYSSFGLLADGGIVLNPLKYIYLGSVVKHFGAKTNYLEMWEYAPVNFRQGIAFKLPFRQNHFLVSLDYSIYPDVNPTVSAGAELRIREPKIMPTATKAISGQDVKISGFSLMAGYQSGYQSMGWSGFSFGFSLEIMMLEALYLDIGGVFLSYGYLGNSERIGIGLNYAPIAKGSKK
jgi:hypothetical protein